MPAFARVAGAWVESTPRGRISGAWTDDDASLFARIDGAWVLIHPDPDAAALLRPVEDLAVTAGPDHHSVTIGWTLPAQPDVTPTDVQVRMADITPVWTELAYPQTTSSWGALDADTEYVAQVRLVARVDGVIVHTSATETVSFATTVAPIGAPAPDPGGTGGDSVFPWTPADNPGPIDDPSLCWFEWKIQILNTDLATWTDTGFTGELAGDTTELPFDLADLDPTRLYRVARREVCGGVPGAWEYGQPFAGLGDWGAACGGLPASASTGFTVTADAIWGFAEMCTVDSGQRQALIDSVTGLEVNEGANFGIAYYDADSEWAVLAGNDPGPVLITPNPDIAATFIAGQDHSISFAVRPDGAWTPTNGQVRALETIGFLHSIQMVETATGWKARIHYLTSSGYFTLDSAEVPADTDWHIITVTWDDSALKTIYIDGVSSASGGNAVQLDTDPPINDVIVSTLPSNWITRAHYGWDRVITPTEVLELTNTLYTAILAIAPDRYYPLRGVSPGALNEEMGNTDLTYYGTALQLNNTAGADGYDYPNQRTTNDSGLSFLAAAFMSPQDGANGLTVGFMMKAPPTGVFQQTMVGMMGTWQITQGAYSNHRGIMAQTFSTAGGANARQRYSDASLTSETTWSLVIVRFGGLNTDFPSIRINGVNITGSLINTANGRNATATGRILDRETGSTAGQPNGAKIAHVFLKDGQISDADCARIEAAAQAEGWY